MHRGGAERERERERGKEREGIPSRLQADSTELDASLNSVNHEILT